MQSLGCNYRVTDIQCALGLSQLGRLGEQLARRRAIAHRYAQAFAGHPALEPLERREGVRSAWHLFVVHLRTDLLRGGRRAVVESLHRLGIGAHVHYIPVHLHPWWRRERGFRPGDFPRAETHYERAVTLPLFPSMQDGDVERVIRAVHDTLAELSR
jgi:perosamine synthetase